LSTVWRGLQKDQRNRIVSQVATFEGQLLSKRFESIGSLVRSHVDSNFLVGPLASYDSYPFIHDFGPWISSKDYIMARLEAEIQLLVTKPDQWYQQRAYWQRQNGGQNALSLTYAKTCYQLFAHGVRQLDLSSFQGLDHFALHHVDLDMSNIMVSYDDPSRIVAIVDWEDAQVMPIWQCMMYDPFLEDYLWVEEPKELQRLRNLRNKVRCGIEPDALRNFETVQFLWEFVTSHWSIRSSLEMLKEKFDRWFEICPQEQAYLFDEVKQMLKTGDCEPFSFFSLFLIARPRIIEIACLAIGDQPMCYIYYMLA
jgi:hypothetical protein